MSEESQKVQQAAEAFTRMWSDFASRTAAAGFSFAPDSTPPEAGRQMRDATFRAMEHYWAEFMRSPQFLEATKQTLDAAVAFRKQFNDFLTRMHHETQGAAREDVDSILLGIRHLETRMLDRIDELATRLDQMSERLAALDGKAGTGGGPKKADVPEAAALPAEPHEKRPTKKRPKR